jgi:RNA 3'-terminal phosphate cyclase
VRLIRLQEQRGREPPLLKPIERFVAEMLLADIAAGGAVDRHLPDQLVLFAAPMVGVCDLRGAGRS